jgi:hypothetical protein
MMGDYVNEEKAIFRKRIIATPVMRKKSAAPVPRNSLALGRKEIPKPQIKKNKSTGNASSFPNNIIYFEDQKPMASIAGKIATKDGISGTSLKKTEEQLRKTNGFERSTLFLYYCTHLLCETIGQEMSEFHMLHKNELMKAGVNSHTLSRRIRKKERENPNHYQFEPLDKEINSPSPPSGNKPGEAIKNMRAAFIDSDGILIDEFISTRAQFEPQQISTTVDLLNSFLSSAKNWMIDEEKILGVVHPNAERAEYIGLMDSIDSIPPGKEKHFLFSAIGYGYSLPPAYRRSISRPDVSTNGGVETTRPHANFLKSFENEILTKLENSLSSNCNDLMERFEGSSELRDTTYCENQSISAYISKARLPSGLENICKKLEPKMIKDVYMNNFVTLYKVTKVDSEHITIEKETFDEPTKKSLEKKLDEMLISIKN